MKSRSQVLRLLLWRNAYGMVKLEMAPVTEQITGNWLVSPKDTARLTSEVGSIKTSVYKARNLFTVAKSRVNNFALPIAPPGIMQKKQEY